MSQLVNDMVPFLEGSWRLERVIDPTATMIGRAIFQPKKHNMLHYSEEGTLRLHSGQNFEARREYIYRFNESGFELLYAEPPFSKIYNIALRVSDHIIKGYDNHVCGSDHYNGEFEFNMSGTVRIINRVAGPRKNYISTTILSR
jgi:hypothetical protein